MPCEPELLLFAGMNDHLRAAGLLEHLKADAPTPKKIWEAIQTLFAAMNEVQENVTSRFGSKTKVAFTTSPGYASMPPALQFVYAISILIAEGNAWRVLMAAPNRGLEPTNLRLLKSELAAEWADGRVSCLEGVLRVSTLSHCIARGPLTRDFESRSTVKAQSGDK